MLRSLRDAADRHALTGLAITYAAIAAVCGLAGFAITWAVLK